MSNYLISTKKQILFWINPCHINSSDLLFLKKNICWATLAASHSTAVGHPPKETLTVPQLRQLLRDLGLDDSGIVGGLPGWVGEKKIAVFHKQKQMHFSVLLGFFKNKSDFIDVCHGLNLNCVLLFLFDVLIWFCV